MTEEKTASKAMIHPLFGDVRKNWGWLLGFGIVSVILGSIGLGMTPSLTLAGVTFFGILLAVGGGFQILDAFKCRGWKGVLLHVLIGLVYLVAGIVMAVHPLRAAVALTLLIGIAVIAAGLLRIWAALQHKGNPGWVWRQYSRIWNPSPSANLRSTTATSSGQASMTCRADVHPSADLTS